MAFEGGGRGERGIVERSEEFTTVQRRLNDSAVEIGREFERMINKYGCQAVDGILPRVTYIMEQLDSLSETNSMIRNENEELKIKLNHYERQEKNRKKLEADFEFIETNLTEELLELRNENYQLKHSSASSKHFDTIDFVASSTSSPGYSLESVDSIEFQRENGGKIYLQDKLHEKERQVREVFFHFQTVNNPVTFFHKKCSLFISFFCVVLLVSTDIVAQVSSIPIPGSKEQTSRNE